MYIGNDLQIANPSYKIIDDISSGFNGSTTSFALQVGGASPVPFPINTQQVMISVNGVVQEPDPGGSAGFKLLGSNIVFSSAPANGHAFFGVIYAGADYVTAGSEFPDGTVASPSFTFESDTDTGWYRIGSGSVGFTSNGVKILDFDGNGLDITGTCTATSFAGPATQVTVADESTDTSCNVLFTTAATGNLPPKSGTNLTFNSNTGALTATSFVGALTGNVTGNASGSAATVTGAAQSAITSVGTLTGLTVDGDVTLTGAANNVVWDKSDNALEFADSAKAIFGTGSDLNIYHDGTNSHLDNNTGEIVIDSPGAIKLGRGGTVICYTETDHLRFNDSKKINWGSASDLSIYHDGSNSYITNTTGELRVSNLTGTGTVSDSIGNLRTLGVNNAQGSAYTLVAADAGKIIRADNNVTLPVASAALFSAGQMVSVLNNSGSAISLNSASGVALYNSATEANGNKSIAARGMVTIFFLAAHTAYVSGAGLTDA